MMPALEVLAVVGALTVPPVPAAVVPPGPAIPWAELNRREIARARAGPDVRRAMAARLGAALAWRLADLPRRRVDGLGLPGGPQPGALALGPLGVGVGAGRETGGAIGALITRWNALYPPYALEGMNGR